MPSNNTKRWELIKEASKVAAFHKASFEIDPTVQKALIGGGIGAGLGGASALLGEDDEEEGRGSKAMRRALIGGGLGAAAGGAYGLATDAYPPAKKPPAKKPPAKVPGAPDDGTQSGTGLQSPSPEEAAPPYDDGLDWENDPEAAAEASWRAGLPDTDPDSPSYIPPRPDITEDGAGPVEAPAPAPATMPDIKIDNNGVLSLNGEVAVHPENSPLAGQPIRLPPGAQYLFDAQGNPQVYIQGPDGSMAPMTLEQFDAAQTAEQGRVRPEDAGLDAQGVPIAGPGTSEDGTLSGTGLQSPSPEEAAPTLNTDTLPPNYPGSTNPLGQNLEGVDRSKLPPEYQGSTNRPDLEGVDRSKLPSNYPGTTNPGGGSSGGGGATVDDNGVPIPTAGRPADTDTLPPGTPGSTMLKSRQGPVSQTDTDAIPPGTPGSTQQIAPSPNSKTGPDNVFGTADDGKGLTTAEKTRLGPDGKIGTKDDGTPPEPRPTRVGSTGRKGQEKQNAWNVTPMPSPEAAINFGYRMAKQAMGTSAKSAGSGKPKKKKKSKKMHRQVLVGPKGKARYVPKPEEDDEKMAALRMRAIVERGTANFFSAR